ncbi:hypothetical protein LZ198_07885 [Myxococcus sp. K15C18031901]|uniref:hypothetical protein n=1 Tax=Myxococcus dinghuensis TaxID=2906761 RepID=UPI0020A79B61|nr:hypothetical protein [Myxococcus dinghuensis]MCP3098793.1 hypothetical protein [Myxococcus dinghuensis]
MQVKTLVMSIMLVAGLLTGCGAGIDEVEPGAAPSTGGERGEVTAQACSDCSWLYVRCRSRAQTPEAAQECEDARALCEETFCYPVRAASACSDACDTRLNACLRAGTVHMLVCFGRHDECMQNCPIEE